MYRKFKSVSHILFVVSAALLLTNPEAGAREENFVEAGADPRELYGAGIDFDVYRKGKIVGYHRVWFDTDGYELIVSSKFHLEIRILFFTVFEYLYQAEERWQGGQLTNLEATVDDNGNPNSLSARRLDNNIAVTNSEGSFFESAPIYPTNHWNAMVLRETRVLNTLTGRINNVAIKARGREKISTENGEVGARRYSYTGELEADVWYDDAGRWVKLRFEAQDGSVIDYVCKKCQGPTVKQVER